MTHRPSPRHFQELAALQPRPRFPLSGFERVGDHLLRHHAATESAFRLSGPGLYGLFEEMEDKDPHLFSILQTRKFGILARPRRIQPASPSAADRDRAAWLGDLLDELPDWDGALMHLLDALAKGMAVLEIVWGFDAGGRVVPARLKPRNPGRFVFGPAAELRLLDEDERLGLRPGPLDSTAITGGSHPNGFASPRPVDPFGFPVPGRRLPDRKFIVLLKDSTDERPYGKGLLERLYWYWWFKKNNLKFWVLYNERFGSPTVVAKHCGPIAPDERDRLTQILETLQADTGIVIPDAIALELLESRRASAGDSYADLADWCNDEMTRAVLGQTLTTGEGRRAGSLALARVHSTVRFDYIRTDACFLMDAVNAQLVRWIIDFNFGPDSPAPRWTIDLQPEIDREVEIGIDRQLLQMGVPLPLRYFYEKYGRPEAAEGDRPLRYDDSNLFQYHLQFGVITVNEVRSALGLPPVPWGDRPTSPANAPTSSRTRGFAGDDPLDLEREPEPEEPLRPRES